MTTHDESQPTSIEFSHELFMRFVKEGNVDGIVNLYEPDAVFISREGKVSSGSSAIRELYRDLLTITNTTFYCHYLCGRYRFGYSRLAVYWQGTGWIWNNCWRTCLRYLSAPIRRDLENGR